MTEIPAADQSLERPEDHVAFILGERRVSVGEVIRAAHFLGEVQTHWLDLLKKIACENHAAEHDLEPDGDASQAVADEFRYSRDLITTDETEQWLASRGLSSDDFLTHVSRCYWKQAVGNAVPSPDAPFIVAEPETRAQLSVELLLTGAFSGMARDLAWRMAAYEQHRATGEGDLALRLEAEKARFLARHDLDGASLVSWLEIVGGNETWLEEMVALEAAYSHHCEKVVTPERLTRELRSQRLALMRFEVEEIEFDTMEAAREAVLCVRTDGLSMEEVARESRYPYRRYDFVLGDLPEAWQVPLLSTPDNSLAGPLTDGDLIRLFRIVHKIEPTLTDELIRPRLEQRIVAASFDELCAGQGYKVIC